MDEFKVSRSTILRDLDAITGNTCFQKIPGKDGGIFADEGWFASGFNKKLKHTEEETAFLDDLMESIPLEKREKFQSFRNKYA